MTEVFCVQDRTGTAAQLTIDVETTDPIEVGDTGAYTGRDYKGTSITLDFTVGAVNGPHDFCITTMTPTGGPGDVSKSNWPNSGTITWLTGGNSLVRRIRLLSSKSIKPTCTSIRLFHRLPRFARQHDRSIAARFDPAMHRSGQRLSRSAISLQGHETVAVSFTHCIRPVVRIS
jgi:hypothetical protein